MKIRKHSSIGLLLVLLHFLLASCQQPTSNNESEYDLISGVDSEKITFKNIEMLSTSMFAQSIDYVPLELLDNNYIGEIFKIEYEDSIFLLGDKLTSRIYGFSSTGKFKFKIDAIGKGPGEYTELTDFYVSDGGELHIFCRNLQKILVFDFKGIYIREIPIKHYVDAIIKINDDEFITYASVSDFVENSFRPAGLSLLSLKNGALLSTNFFTFGGNYASNAMKQFDFFSHNQDDVFVLTPSDTIFSYNPTTGMNSKYILDFGDMKMNNELKNLPNTIDSHELLNKSEKVRLKDYLVTSGKFISFEFLVDSEIMWGFRNQNQGQMIYSHMISDDINGFPYSAPIAKKGEDEIISVITQDQWISFHDGLNDNKELIIDNKGNEYFEAQLKIVNKMIKNDQPILAISKLKK